MDEDTSSGSGTKSSTNATGPARRFSLAVPSQRVLQIVLGLFWILDAALQFQPFMFGRGFVEANILANAQGQPFVVGDLITHIGNFVAPDIAVWNTFFALIQLVIGVGLLYRPTVKPALALSFAWVLGVWVFGEGLGMLLTGTATRADGRAGQRAHVRPHRPDVLAPRARAGPSRGAGLAPVGIASSAAAQGIGRSITPMAVWSGYWCLAAVLFLFPDNRTPSSVQSAIVGMADGEPGWFSHFLTSLGNQFANGGTQTAWVLALLCLVVGIGPLLVRRPGWFLAGGAVLALVHVGGRPGPGGRRVQRFGHRSQHGAAGDPARRGHGAAGRRHPDVLGPARPGAGAPGSRRRPVQRGGAGRRPGPQRHLPGGLGGVELHGHGGHDHERQRRHDERIGVGHLRHLPSAPDRSQAEGARPQQHALHDHGREVGRHGHERRRRQRGRRLQRDQAQLELHRSRPAPGRGAAAAGRRQQRAQGHRDGRATAAPPS